MLTVFAVAVCVVGGSGVVAPECQAIIDANTRSNALIRTVQLHYSREYQRDPKHGGQTWWSRDGVRERIREVGANNGQIRAGRPTAIYDVLITNNRFYLLKNWDPNTPQPITPLIQGTVRAVTGAYVNENPGPTTPSADLLFEMPFTPRRTLAELASVSPTVGCRGWVMEDGRRLFCISLETPEAQTETTIKWYVDVFVDPKAGHMIRKVKLNAPKRKRANGQLGVSRTEEVVDFRDCGDGIFVPSLVRRKDEKSAHLVDFVVDGIRVNQSIPEAEFAMEWPKYVAVNNLPLVGGKSPVDIWGDGKPLRRVRSVSDVKALEEELTRDPVTRAEFDRIEAEFLLNAPARRASWSMALIVANVVVLALVVGGVWFWRRST
jgi:hypothetical protein